MTLTFWYIFEITKFKMLITGKFWNACYDFCINTNVVFYDRYLNFHGETFEMLISRKWWKLTQKCIMSFIDFDICCGLRMLRSITLTFIFKIKHFLLMQNCAITVDVFGRFSSTHTVFAKEFLLLFYLPNQFTINRFGQESSYWLQSDLLQVHSWSRR